MKELSAKKTFVSKTPYICSQNKVQDIQIKSSKLFLQVKLI